MNRADIVPRQGRCRIHFDHGLLLQKYVFSIGQQHWLPTKIPTTTKMKKKWTVAYCRINTIEPKCEKKNMYTFFPNDSSQILCIIENMFELLCFWSKISLPLLFFQQNVVDCFWLKNINKRIKLTVYKNICRCHHLVNKSHIEKTYIDPSHPQLGLGIYLELFWLPPFFYNSIASPSWNKHTFMYK